jgi:hypothetical protein
MPDTKVAYPDIPMDGAHKTAELISHLLIQKEQKVEA